MRVSLALLCLCGVCAAADEADVAALLAGVDEIITAGGIPNPVATFGDQAFVVMTGRAGRQRAPLFAAARYGRGRVLAGGHDGMFGAGVAGDPDNVRLLTNAVAWLGGQPTGLTVLRYGCDNLVPPLEAAGHTVATVSQAELLAELPDADVVLTSGISISGQPTVIEALARFVENGGGLLINTVAWGWQQLTPQGDILRDLGGNVLCTRMGLAWPEGMLDGTSENGFRADGQQLELSHAGLALRALSQHVAGGPQLDAAAMAQVSRTLSDTVRALPADHPFTASLRQTSAAAGGDAVPTNAAPVKLDNPFARIRAQLDLAAWRRAEPEQITAYPGASDFPGAVPADAPRVTKVLAIDTGVPDWHSTGLYVPAGEVVRVTIPAAAAGQGLALRVGCHTDGIWHLDQWRRFPEISTHRPLNAAETKVASPFGGLLYVIAPRGRQLGTVEVTVAGAVEAPLFVNGRTSLVEWRETIRHRPAPWGEFATDKVIFSVPSRVLQTLDDPEKLCAFWDQVMDACADLAQIPRERERPERYVPDIQISAGYMHSGYPIMTWMDQPEIMVDRDRLRREGSWGMFHEVGHNHQSGHWTFGGTGEVTVNLFSLYILERCCDSTVGVHPAITGEERRKKMAAYLANGAKFGDWQSDPFLALAMYYQLKEAFGWGAFERVFAGYRDAPDGTLPRGDEEKRDQWMVRFSREVGRDLGPFFQRWGVPTSEAARASIADLPDWMPDGF